MILRETLLLLLPGIALGLAGAFAATRFISSLLFGLESTDPKSMGGAVLFLIAVAGFAGYLPARRASRVDPIQALRHE